MSKDKLDSIKSKIYRNKKWTTTIDKKRNTMSHIDGLVNKIEKKSINRNEAIDIYNDIIKKGKIIAKERQTKNTQKFKKKNW